MSSTYIDTVPFAHRTGGPVQLPQRDAKVFTSPLMDHVGGQVSPKRGPAFTLTVTKFADPDVRLSIEDFVNSRIGRVVDLSIDGVAYALPSHGGVGFFCSQARVIYSGQVPHACGYHDGVPFDYQPAAKVVSQWTFYAVPYSLFV